MTKKALVIVCVQNDFCKDGSLAVSELAGPELVKQINAVKRDGNWDLVAIAYDWHPLNHCSFWQNHPSLKEGRVVQLDNHPQVMWPQHCVQGSHGSMLHEKLVVNHDDVHIFAGVNPRADSYSAFMDKGFYGEDNQSLLRTYLERNQIEEVYCCGLATDVCVQYTLIDAVSPDESVGINSTFNAFLIGDCSQAISEKGLQATHENLETHNIKVVGAKDLVFGKARTRKLEGREFPTGNTDEDILTIILALTDKESAEAQAREVGGKLKHTFPPSLQKASPKTGRTILHELCRIHASRATGWRGALLLEMVEAVIAHNVESTIVRDQVTKQTPLMMACRSSNLKLVVLLLDALSKVNTPFDLDALEREIAVEPGMHTPEDLEALQGDESMLRLLFQQMDVHRTGMITRHGLREFLEMNCAIVSEEITKELFEELDKDGDAIIDVDEFTQNVLIRQYVKNRRNQKRRASGGRLALMSSPSGKNLASQVYGALCMRGELVNMTAIMFACQAKNADIFKLLVERSKDFDDSLVPFVLTHIDRYGRTPLHFACESVNIGQAEDMEFITTVFDLYEGLLQDLSPVAWKALLRADSENWTYLHYCVRKGLTPVVERTCQTIKKIVRNPANQTFTEWLVVNLVRILMEPVTRGHNILHLAAWVQNEDALKPLIELVKLLNATEVAIDTLTVSGWSVLDLALYASLRPSSPDRAAGYNGVFHDCKPECAMYLVRQGFVPVRTAGYSNRFKDGRTLCYYLLQYAFLVGEGPSDSENADTRGILYPLLCKPEYGVSIDENFVTLIHSVRHHNWCTEKSILSATEIRGGLVHQPIFRCRGRKDMAICAVCSQLFNEPVCFEGVAQVGCNYQRLAANAENAAGSLNPISAKFRDELIHACLICAARQGDDMLVRRVLQLSKANFSQLKHQPYATPLHAAVANGHHQVSRRLLRAGDDKSQAPLVAQHNYKPMVLRTDTRLKRTPLHVAAYRGDKALCNLILRFTSEEARGKLLLLRDAKNLTPLHLAVLSCSAETVEYLCGELTNSGEIRGVNDLYRREHGHQNVSIVFRPPAESFADTNFNAQTTFVKIAAQAISRPNVLKPDELVMGESFVITRFVKAPSEAPSLVDESFMPEFHHYGLHLIKSVTRGVWEVVAPTLNAMWTPLHLAVWTAQLDVIKVLLGYHADPAWRAPLKVSVYEANNSGNPRLIHKKYNAKLPSALDLAIGIMRNKRTHLSRVEEKRSTSWITLEAAFSPFEKLNCFKRCLLRPFWYARVTQHRFSSHAAVQRSEEDEDNKVVSHVRRSLTLQSLSRLPSISARHRKKKHTTDAEAFNLAQEGERNAAEILEAMYESPFVKTRVDWRALRLFVRKTMFYILYLVGFMFVAFPKFQSITFNPYYHFTHAIRENCVDRFHEVADTREAMFDFLETRLPNFAPDSVYGDSHVIGPVRLRQVLYDVHSASDCIDISEVTNWQHNCSGSTEIRDDLSSIYTYGGVWHKGEGDQWRDYPKGGYIVDLPRNDTRAREILATLRSEEWLSVSTSQLFIDATIYSPNFNVFGVMRLVRERLPSGALDKNSFLTSASLFNDESEYLTRMPSVLVKVLVIILFVGVLTSEGGDMLKLGLRRYVAHPWNVYDIVIGLLVLAVLGLDTRATSLVNDIGHIDVDREQFVDFFTPSYTIGVERDLIALVVVACFVRLMKYLKVAPFVGPTVIAIMDTMLHSSVVIFGLVLFVFILAFSFAYTVAIGWYLEEVRTVRQAFASLYTLAVGIDIGSSLRHNPITNLLFFLFTVFNMLVLFNLLIAVISNVYPDKKQQSEGNWRRIVFQSMESEIPQLFDAKLRYQQGHNRLRRALLFVVEVPVMLFSIAHLRYARIFPHNWKYADNSGDVVYDELSDDSDEEDEETSKGIKALMQRIF